MFSAILAFFLRMCSVSLLFLYHPFEVFCSSCFLLENICSVSFFCFSSIPYVFCTSAKFVMLVAKSARGLRI
jgi:hypothetical protein